MKTVQLKKSSGSVKIYLQDLQKIKKLLRTTLKTWKIEFPEIIKVYIFGSFVNGDFGPGSDVDILLVLSHCSYHYRDRAAVYCPDKFPYTLDLFPYTLNEIEGMRNCCSVFNTAKKTGIEIILNKPDKTTKNIGDVEKLL